MKWLPLLVLSLPALAEDAAAIRRDLAAGHAELAARCEKDGLVEEAIRERQEAGEKAKGRPWVLGWEDAIHEKYVAYSKDRAALLEGVAQRWLDLGDAKAAVETCPEFGPARAKLGEVFANGAWVPAADADRLLADLLPMDGKWLPAEEVKKRRSKWTEAWEVRGRHFVVRSNRSDKSARDVLALAESVFAAVHRELAGEVDAPAPKKLFAVYDFATRADLLAHLDAVHEGGGDHRASAGFFSTLDGASHFAPVGDGFGLGDADVERHEIAHQVIDAMWAPQGKLADRAHFWAWEGIACFFESTEVRDGKVLVGNRSHPRLSIARRALEDKRTLPLDDFVKLDGEGVKGRYNQAASLAHFFMLSSGGKLREAFLKYLRVVASGKAEEDAFEKAFGRKPGEFQSEWEAWVREK